jgi:hypothetical protein
MTESGVSVPSLIVSPSAAGCFVAASALAGAIVGNSDPTFSMWAGALGFLAGAVLAGIWNSFFVAPEKAAETEAEAETEEANEAESDAAEAEPVDEDQQAAA